MRRGRIKMVWTYHVSIDHVVDDFWVLVQARSSSGSTTPTTITIAPALPLVLSIPLSGLILELERRTGPLFLSLAFAK